MIGKYLDLSVAHFTCETLERLYDGEIDSVITYPKTDKDTEITCGAFVHVPDEFDEEEDLPEDLSKVFAYARGMDCYWLQIDQDADIIPELPRYDEEAAGHDKETGNTVIEYLYRDASNYKVRNRAIVKGEINEAQKERILECLYEGEYFIPEQIGLPAKRFDEVNKDDHCWMELDEYGFDVIDEEADVNMSVDDLVKSFEEAREKGWNDVKYAIVA